MSEDPRGDLPMPLDENLPIALPLNEPQHEAAPPADEYRDWHNVVSQRHVRSIAVGPHGDLWLATAGGVLRWTADLRYFTRYTSEHGLPGNSMAAIAVSPDDQVWAAHQSGQLCYLDNGIWQLYIADNMVDDLRVSHLAIDDSGRVWAASSGGLWLINNPQQRLPQVLGPDLVAPPLALTLGSSDEAWVCNAQGVYHYDALEPQPPLEITGMLTLAQKETELWLGTVEGLLCIDLATDQVVESANWPRGEVTALAASGSGVWAACAGQVGFATTTGWQAVPAPPLSTRVTGLVPAGPEEVWIATHDGLAHGGPDGIRWQQTDIPPEAISVFEQSPVAFCNLVQALAIQHSDQHSLLWIGTPRGLFRLDLFDQSWRPYIWSGMEDVRALAVDTFNQELWAASWTGGLRRIQGRIVSADVPKDIPRPVLALSASSSQEIWACVPIGDELARQSEVMGSDGLYHGVGAQWSLALQTSALHEAGLPVYAWTQALAHSADQKLWIGTSAGLFEWNILTRIVSLPDPTVGASSVRALQMISQPTKQLCVGTARGLFIGPPGALTNIVGLEGRSITALAWDGDNDTLWVGTQSGLVQLDRPTGWQIVHDWNAYNSGLAADHVTALALSASEAGTQHVWVGTPCGISYYCFRCNQEGGCREPC